MSPPQPLDVIVHTRFREAFGESHAFMHDGEQWSLPLVEGGVSVSVLVNGTQYGPSVWVFDPRDPENGVVHTAILSIDQIETVIEQIRQRVRTPQSPSN